MTTSIDMFDTYSGNFEDSDGAKALKQTFLASAGDIVQGYLGFDPVLQVHTDVCVSGTGTRRLYLPHRNVTEITELTIGTTAIDCLPILACDDHIRFADGFTVFPSGKDNIRLTYTAGWADDLMPSVITLSVLRIATLMLSETGGNIGLTGKSFADNSRTFVNYSNYRRYLQPLDTLRIVGF